MIFIEDFSRTKIYITNLWQEWYLPKFRLSFEVSEPILTISYGINEQTGQSEPFVVRIDYRDVVDGYSGYASNPSSAAELQGMIEDMIDSAWTDISGGGEFSNDEIEAIHAGENPSGVNEFMTHSAVVSLLLAAGQLFNADLFADGNDIGIGTNQTLASLGYDAAEAAAAWPLVDADARYTVDVNTTLVDTMALGEMFLFMQENCISYMQDVGGRAYMVDQTVYPPINQNNWACTGSAGTRSLDKFEYQFSGSGVFNGTGFDGPTMSRFPADQTEAVSDYLNTTFIFHNLFVGGNGGDLADVDNVAFRLAASTKSQLNNCTFLNATVVCAIYFGIGGEVNNCQFFNWGTYGLLLSNGRDGDAFGGGWSGGGTSDCQTNQTIVNNPRFVLTTNTSDSACHHFGGYRCKVINPIVEGIGGDPETVTMFHYLASGDGVEQLFNIEGLSVENLVCTRAGIRIESEKGMSNLKNTALYLGDPNTQMPVLIEGDNRTGGSGQPMIFIDDQYCGRPFRSIENTATPSFQFRWIIKDAYPADYTDIFDAANWDTSFSGFIPDAAYVRYTPPLV